MQATCSRSWSTIPRPTRDDYVCVSEGARQQAQAEGLTLRVADSKTGYFSVHLDSRGKLKPYQGRVMRGGKILTLGSFATAEEAALCVARSPEGQAAAVERAAAAAPLTSEEARQQAQAERLKLLKANNKTGYYGVVSRPGQPKPYEAKVRRGDKNTSLGSFATAEEAALCVARTSEGQAEARKAAVSPTSKGVPRQAKADGPTTPCQQGRTGHTRSSNVSPARPFVPTRARWSQGPRLTSYRRRATSARVTSIGGGGSRV